MSELLAPEKEGVASVVSGWFDHFKESLGINVAPKGGPPEDPALVKARASYRELARQVELDVARLVKKTSAERAAKAQALLEQAKTEAESATTESFLKGAQSLRKANGELQSHFQAFFQEEQEAKLQKSKRAEYQVKLAEKQEVLSRLAALPGLSVMPQLKALQAIVVKAESAAKNEKCEDALRILGGLDKINEQEFATTSKKLVQQLGSLEGYDAATSAMAALKRLEPATAWAVDDLLMQKSLAAVLDLRTETEAAAFLKLSNQLTEKVAGLQQQAQAAGELSQKLEASWKVAQPFLPPDDALSFSTDLETFRWLRQAQDAEGAVRFGTGLLRRLDRRSEALQAASEQWASRSMEVENLTVMVGMIKTSQKPEAPKHLIGRAESLLALVQPTSGVPDYRLLLANLQTALTEMEALQFEFADFSSFAQTREQADVAMQVRFKEADAQVAGLVQELTKRGVEKPGATVEVVALQADLAALRSQWEVRVGRAYNEETLKPKATEEQLVEFGHRVLAAGTEEGLTEVVGGATAQKEREELAAGLVKLRELIAQVRATGPGEAIRLTGDAAAAEEAGLTAGGQTEALATVLVLQGEATRAIEAATQERASVQAEVTARLLNFDAEAKKLEAKGGPYRKAAAAMVIERDKLEKAAASENLDALKFVQDELGTLITRTGNLLEETVLGSKTPDRMTLVEVLQKQERVWTMVDTGRKHLQKFSPALEKQLFKRWETLEKTIPTLSPNEGDARLSELARDLETARIGADAVAELQLDVQGRLQTATVDLAQLVKLDRKSLYLDDLTKRLETAKTMSGEVDKLLGAQSRLQELQEELVAARGSLAVVTAKVVELQAQVEQKKKAEAQWESASEQMAARLKDVKKLIESQHGDVAQHEELVRLFELAKATQKDGDPATALRQLVAMGEQVKKVTADPSGPTLGSRNALPEDMKKYQESLQLFLGALNGLPAKVLTVVPDLRGDVQKKMVALLQSVAASLPVHAFASVVGQMTKPGATAAQLRAAREVGLGKVRQLLVTLAGHPQLQTLLESPVETGTLSTAFQRLRNSLTRLEANLSRACN